MEQEYPRRVLRLRDDAKGTTAAYDDIEFGPVPNGEQWHVCNIAVVDEDNTITKWGVFIRARHGDYWITERLFTTKDLHRGWECGCYLREGEKLVVRITGATSGDTLRAWVTGYYEEIGELVGAPTRFGEM